MCGDEPQELWSFTEVQRYREIFWKLKSVPFDPQMCEYVGECQITRTNSMLTQRKAKKGSFGPNAFGALAHAHIGSNKHHQITHESVVRNENTVYGY